MIIQTKNIFAAIFFSLLAACASKVSYDYDSEYNFSQLRTFAVNAARNNDELMNKRLTASVKDTLTAKNYSANAQNADFKVTHDLSNGIHQAKKKPSVSLGAGTGNWKPKLGVGINMPVGGNKVTHTLKISITDSSDRLIWQGQDTLKLSEGSGPDEKRSVISSVTSKILSQFPSR
jgi:hypothetical protein